MGRGPAAREAGWPYLLRTAPHWALAGKEGPQSCSHGEADSASSCMSWGEGPSPEPGDALDQPTPRIQPPRPERRIQLGCAGATVGVVFRLSVGAALLGGSGNRPRTDGTSAGHVSRAGPAQRRAEAGLRDRRARRRRGQTEGTGCGTPGTHRGCADPWGWLSPLGRARGHRICVTRAQRNASPP